MKSAAKGIEKWMHTYGIPKEVCSDGGPYYGKEFSEWCKSMGIRHCLSSAYNPQSNGSAEKGVGQIKNLLEKMGRKGVLNQDELNRLVFKLNCHVTSGQGSALENSLTVMWAPTKWTLSRRNKPCPVNSKET